MRTARRRRRRGKRCVCTLMCYWPATVCMLFIQIVDNISYLVGLLGTLQVYSRRHTAQPPATGAVVYTALLKMYPFVHLSVRVSFAILKKLSPTHFVFSFLCIVWYTYLSSAVFCALESEESKKKMRYASPKNKMFRLGLILEIVVDIEFLPSFVPMVMSLPLSWVFLFYANQGCFVAKTRRFFFNLTPVYDPLFCEKKRK